MAESLGPTGTSTGQPRAAEPALRRAADGAFIVALAKLPSKTAGATGGSSLAGLQGDPRIRFHSIHAAVYFFPVSHFHHKDDENFVSNLIDRAVVLPRSHMNA